MDADGNNQDIDFNMETTASPTAPFQSNPVATMTANANAGFDIDMISSQFRGMNTNDKEHLVSEFRRLSNTDLSNEGCCFYLDMAEWNLNTALWAYYEYETAGGGLSATSLNAVASTGTATNTLTTT